MSIIIRNLGVNISLYADDAVIYCSDQDRNLLKLSLERSLSTIYDWCASNYININAQKTKSCVYGYRSIVKTFEDKFISINGQHITKYQQYNYLGVLTDECMTLVSNFNSVFKKFSHKMFQFGKIKNYINTATHILVYKQTILPLVECVSCMLYLNNIREIGKLQKLQNRCLQMCFNVNS